MRDSISIGIGAVLVALLVAVWAKAEQIQAALAAHVVAPSSSAIVYRAEWIDAAGVTRSVETRATATESLALVLVRHRAEIDAIAILHPPR